MAGLIDQLVVESIIIANSLLFILVCAEQAYLQAGVSVEHGVTSATLASFFAPCS